MKDSPKGVPTCGPISTEPATGAVRACGAALAGGNMAAPALALRRGSAEPSLNVSRGSRVGGAAENVGGAAGFHQLSRIRPGGRIDPEKRRWLRRAASLRE